MKDKTKYINSNETKKQLSISSCKLMHLRIEGKLNFIKKGNTFLYNKNNIEKLK